MHSVSNDLKLGVTAGSYLGLGVKFDNTWSGRYYVQEEDFATSFLNGSVGYKVNNKDDVFHIVALSMNWKF